jgi:DNA end-binding protein Ku
MLFGDEVLPPDRLDELDGLADAEATDRELKMAQQLIDSLSTDFDPERFHDEYRERVLELIERKASGEQITVEPLAEEPEEVPDLMAALEASLAAVKSDGPDEPEPAAKPKSRKRAASSSANGGKTAGKKPAKTKG